MSNEVVDLIAALRDGTISLEQLAARFRERAWPRTAAEPPSSYIELARREQEDPDPYVPGSFDDVAAAFHSGQLSRDEYAVLADAAAASMRAEDEQRSAGAAGSE
ncbi:MAG TPA: hypothetical protein VGG35_21820 [Streptosporangiaceae bacterium]|jgi:hypothetical protein